MTKRAKTTRIEKKYTDRKTGEEKKITIDYSKVVDRLNEFRKENPRGLIETTPSFKDDMIIFNTHILRDKSDKFSAEATGHAMTKNDGGEKVLEKTETISVGRALALLGYAAGGEIASADEMEEFAAYRDQKIEEIIEKMSATKTMEKLREYFMSLGSYMAESRIIEAKDSRKKALSENAD